MSSLVRKLFSALRLYKFGLLRVILNRLFSGIFRYQTIILYYFDLKKGDPVFPLKKESVTFERIDNHQEELFKKLCEACSEQRFTSRIKQENKECYVGLYNGEIITYAWITYKEFFIEELNYTYSLESGEFFIYDCFVSREHRGKGIYPAMLCKILRDYRKKNAYSLAYIGASSVNSGSLRGIEKTGFKEYNRIRYAKCLNKEKWWGLGRRPVAAGSVSDIFSDKAQKERSVPY